MAKSKSAGRKAIKVTFEQQSNGWRAHVPGGDVSEAWGRSISEARRKMKQNLSVASRKGDIADDVRLPPAVKKEIDRHAEARARALAEQEELRKATRAVVATLTSKHGISLRDASALLGLSRERIRQLTG